MSTSTRKGVKIYYYVPPELKKVLDRLSQELDITLTEITREAVLAYLPQLNERVKIVKAYRPGVPGN